MRGEAGNVAVVGRIMPSETMTVKIGLVLVTGDEVDAKINGKFGFFFEETSDKRLRFRVLRRVRPTAALRKNGVTERDGATISLIKSESAIARKGSRRLRPT